MTNTNKAPFKEGDRVKAKGDTAGKEYTVKCCWWYERGIQWLVSLEGAGDSEPYDACNLVGTQLVVTHFIVPQLTKREWSYIPLNVLAGYKGGDKYYLNFSPGNVFTAEMLEARGNGWINIWKFSEPIEIDPKQQKLWFRLNGVYVGDADEPIADTAVKILDVKIRRIYAIDLLLIYISEPTEPKIVSEFDFTGVKEGD